MRHASISPLLLNGDVLRPADVHALAWRPACQLASRPAARAHILARRRGVLAARHTLLAFGVRDAASGLAARAEREPRQQLQAARAPADAPAVRDHKSRR